MPTTIKTPLAVALLGTVLLTGLVAPPARAQTKTPITKDRAEELVWALPEIKAWAKHIDRTSHGSVHGATMVDPETPVTRRGKRYWSIDFVEDQPEQTHRWQTFLVRLDGREILVDSDDLATYRTLHDWRAQDHPLDRAREAKTPR